ncbi:MAG: ABC transporter ATP-binding protein [Propionibacteriaceae bacterium]|nr:ABC transporter ATP-binding protein [Propionibacteriaceae bacterium]
MTEVLVAGQGVKLSYPLRAGAVRALRGVDIEIRAGETVVLFGASGSGKSSLLNVIAGLDVPYAGSLRVVGADVAALSGDERARLRLDSVGMVFQDNNLVGQFSAVENVELILRCQGTANAKTRAKELLSLLGVGDLADRLPVDMSGGQRQRVGIARALAGDRKLILCDEPTGALDQENSRMLFGLLRQLSHDKGVGVLVATHDLEAERYADRVLTVIDGVVK